MTESPGGPVIEVSQPGRTTLRLVVVEPMEVGRDCIGLLLDDERVSRRHLELRPQGSGLGVRDLGSSNGTTIDGRPLDEPAILAPGQVLRLGDTLIAIVGAAPGLTGGGSSDIDRMAQTSIERVAEAVVNEGVVVPAAAEGRTRTIVFSDIESSTELAVRLGDVRWFEVLEAHNVVLRSSLHRHRGTEVKSQGDGFMLTFGSARAAVAFMVEVQLALSTDDLGCDGLQIRVGAHTGEALETADGDLFGRAVIMAARVGAAALGGEILISSLVREIVESWGELRFGPERAVELKGLGGRHVLHPVLWSPASSDLG